MIEYRSGNFINEPGIKVITVNCVGVPGRGLALQWAQADPKAAEHYKYVSQQRKLLRPGQVMYYAPWLMAATKDHWRDPSQMEWIDSAMFEIVGYAERWEPTAIHIPPMGAGLGGLDKSKVKAVIERHISLRPGEHTWVLWNF